VIRIRRVYDEPRRGEGRRVLVDGLWPRGIRKDELAHDEWLKEIAPSAALRRWYGHDVARWPEFRTRYRRELAARRDALAPLVDAARRGTVTLLFGARDAEHNNAVVLKEYLEEQLT
jgi:uncharacterized protein YeaO (DUF488 family)